MTASRFPLILPSTTGSSVANVRLLTSVLFGVALLATSMAACDGTGVKVPECDDPAGCSEDEPEANPPRIFVDPPFGVGFECVSVGCDDDRVMTVQNRGGGTLKISNVRLSVDSSTDFSIRVLREREPTESDDEGLGETDEIAFPTPEAPIVLKEGGSFRVHVRYRPGDAIADEAMLNVSWFNGNTSYDDAVVSVVEAPISTRILGEPVAELVTPDLNFGFVQVGAEAVANVEITNSAEGNAPLALAIPEFSLSSSNTFRVDVAGDRDGFIYVNPGETVRIPVTFAPNDSRAFEGLLFVATNDGARPQLSVSVSGTAIASPWFQIEQPDDWLVDFGEVPVGEQRTQSIVVRNMGGEPLRLTPRMPFGTEDGFSALIPIDVPLAAIPPLGRMEIDVASVPEIGGSIYGELGFETNDPTLPYDWVDLAAYGIYPQVDTSPEAIDLGEVVQFWTSPAQSFAITNPGTGELTVTGIEFEIGSSSQIIAADLPPVPFKITSLSEPVMVSVYLDAQSLGPADAALLIHSDSPDEPTKRVPITASVISCDAGCPVANGTPTCDAGQCEISDCLGGYHDADQRFDTGCECTEDVGGDIGPQCFDGFTIGNLSDTNSPKSVTRSGTLHSMDDVDLYYYRARDDSSIGQTFDDNYRAEVTLENGPPGLLICARFAEGAGCGGENQANCSNYRLRGQNGGSGREDSEDVTVWVRWAADAAPMCGSYTIRMRADAG